MVREKYLENEIFSRSGKSQGILGQGNLERTLKVWEFENKWLWLAVFRKFIYSVQEEKDVGLQQNIERQKREVTLNR